MWHKSVTASRMMRDSDGGSSGGGGGSKSKPGKMFGSKYQKEKRAEEERAAQSSVSGQGGTSPARSGDYDKSLGRTLGYNDFSRGGMYGPGGERAGESKYYEPNTGNWEYADPASRPGAAPTGFGAASDKAAPPKVYKTADVSAQITAERRAELQAVADRYNQIAGGGMFGDNYIVDDRGTIRTQTFGEKAAAGIKDAAPGLLLSFVNPLLGAAFQGGKALKEGNPVGAALAFAGPFAGAVSPFSRVTSAIQAGTALTGLATAATGTNIDDLLGTTQAPDAIEGYGDPSTAGAGYMVASAQDGAGYSAPYDRGAGREGSIRIGSGGGTTLGTLPSDAPFTAPDLPGQAQGFGNVVAAMKGRKERGYGVSTGAAQPWDVSADTHVSGLPQDTGQRTQDEVWSGSPGRSGTWTSGGRAWG